MSSNEKLHPASFRGVPFQAKSDDAGFGRRGQVDEYPYRDKPHTEDTGRATREFNLTAVLVGADYIQRRDRLLEALETPGPGTLVHPWYGEMQATLKPGALARVSHSDAEGGMCRVQMLFVEAGELAFPSATASRGAQSMASIDGLQAAATDDFLNRFSVVGRPSFVMDDALGVFSRSLDLLQDGIGTIGGLLSNPLSLLRGQGAQLMPDAVNLAVSVFSLFNRGESVLQLAGNVFGGGGSFARNRNAVQSLAAVGRTFNTRANVPISSDIGRNRTQIAKNAAALNDLFANAVLVQAAGMTTAMDLPVYEDAVVIRTDVCTALDQQSLNASDALYRATQEVRANVYRDVTDRLSYSARLVTITPRHGMSALVLAYDRYEDISREAEIVDINALRHPGFPAVDSIKVLSE